MCLLENAFSWALLVHWNTPANHHLWAAKSYRSCDLLQLPKPQSALRHRLTFHVKSAEFMLALRIVCSLWKMTRAYRGGNLTSSVCFSSGFMQTPPGNNKSLPNWGEISWHFGLGSCKFHLVFSRLQLKECHGVLRRDRMRRWLIWNCETTPAVDKGKKQALGTSLKLSKQLDFWKHCGEAAGRAHVVTGRTLPRGGLCLRWWHLCNKHLCSTNREAGTSLGIGDIRIRLSPLRGLVSAWGKQMCKYLHGVQRETPEKAP